MAAISYLLSSAGLTVGGVTIASGPCPESVLPGTAAPGSVMLRVLEQCLVIVRRLRPTQAQRSRMPAQTSDQAIWCCAAWLRTTRGRSRRLRRVRAMDTRRFSVTTRETVACFVWVRTTSILAHPRIRQPTVGPPPQLAHGRLLLSSQVDLQTL